MPNFLTSFRFLITLLFVGHMSVNASAQKEDEIVTVSEYSIECLTPPEGFVTRDGVNGYLHLSTKSSILVTLVNQRNIVDAEEAFSEDYFKREGVTLLSKEEVQTTSGESALLYKFSFTIKDETWHRYSLLLGELNNVLWINGSYPAKYEPVVESSILKSLMTTKFLQK